MIPFLLVGFVLTLTLIVVIVNSSRASKLKTAYDHALLSGDKAAALMAGRAYYAAKNGNGQVRAVDEQAIANDLATMSSNQMPRPTVPSNPNELSQMQKIVLAIVLAIMLTAMIYACANP